jgi:hypothetical protein
VVPTAISAAVPRRRSTLEGLITAVRAYARPWVRFEVEMTDGTGSLTLRFTGRRAVPGMRPGRRLSVEGTPAQDHSTLLMLNPLFEFLPDCCETACVRPGGARAMSGEP